MHLMSIQFNKFSEKFGELCRLFITEEFNSVWGKEKPIIFMVTAIP